MTTNEIRYISLFSGIGGFELGIERVLGNKAKCIGYSEVDKFAINVYTKHFPNHTNLGDVTLITEGHIRDLVEREEGCDLLVGGFPCTNLSSLSWTSFGNSDGLDGPASGLFWNMINIIKWIIMYNPPGKKLHLIIENNTSMTNANKKLVTENLQATLNYPLYMTKMNGADFGVQSRRRLIWTTFEVDTSKIVCEQTWDEVLLPIGEVIDLQFSSKFINYANATINVPSKSKVYIKVHNNFLTFEEKENENGIGQTRIQSYRVSRSNVRKSLPMTSSISIPTSLCDYRIDEDPTHFILRYFSMLEVERLFFFPRGWVVDWTSKTRSMKLLGQSVIVKMIEFIISELKDSLFEVQ